MLALHNLVQSAESFYSPSFASNSDGSEPAVQFMRSLTPEQSQKTREYLPISDMTPEQRQLVVEVAEHIAIQGDTAWLERTFHHLRTLQNPRTSFGWLSISGEEIFGYQGPFGPKNINWMFPLSGGYISHVGGAYIRLSRKKNTDDASNSVDADPSEPTADDRKWAQESVTSTDGAITLKDIVSKAKDFPVSIDDAVAEKTVSAFGLPKTCDEHLANVLAKLYGLRLKKETNDRSVLMLPSPQPLKSVLELPAEIQRLIPDSLNRAYASQANHIYETQVAPRTSDNPINHDQSVKSVLYMSHITATNRYYLPATRRLIALVQPKVPTPQSPPIPVASLGNEEHRLIALMMVSGACMSSAYRLTILQVPQCLMTPEKLAINARPNSKGGIGGFSIGYLDNNGKFHSEIGISESMSAAK